MSDWTETRDSAKQGIAAAWAAMPPASKALLVGLVIGFVMGIGATVAVWR